MGHRLRRLRLQAGHGHAAARALARADGDGRRRPGVAGRAPGRRLAAPDPAPPAGAAGRARVDGEHRLGAGVHPVPRQLRRGAREALPRPRPGEPLQRRLLDLRHHRGRGRDPADPAGDGGRRHQRRGLQGRVQLRPARGQLPLLRRPVDGGQPLDLQERRQGDRLAARARADVHGQVQRARGQLVPHPLLVLGRGRQPVPGRRRPRLQPRCSGTSWPGSWPRRAS